jgi:hypothetical protein
MFAVAVTKVSTRKQFTTGATIKNYWTFVFQKPEGKTM